MKNKLVIVGGPTASGKSDMAVRLAQKINGEIISADSMQVYREMNIGTAKVTPEEMDGIYHYGIDILNPNEEYNIEIFQKMSKKAIEDIYSKGKIPIICGGTGFYIQSVLYDIDFDKSADADDTIRTELTNILESQGTDALFNILKEVDPKSSELIHPNNTKRVIRAIEYYKITGNKISEHNEKESQKDSPYNYHFFVLNDDRDALYKRIDTRVDKMVTEGLLDEVKAVYNKWSPLSKTAREAIGYREIIDHLEGQCSLEESIEAIKQNSRRYAKRQITWFKRENNAIWINRNEYKNSDEMLAKMLDALNI